MVTDAVGRLRGFVDQINVVAAQVGAIAAKRKNSRVKKGEKAMLLDELVYDIEAAVTECIEIIEEAIYRYEDEISEMSERR